jgi:hypothetical protein
LTLTLTFVSLSVADTAFIPIDDQSAMRHCCGKWCFWAGVAIVAVMVQIGVNLHRLLGIGKVGEHSFNVAMWCRVLQ